MGSMVLKINSALSGSDLPPKGYRDPIINTDVIGLFDFTEPFCNPNADGTLAAGAAFRDLVNGGAGGVVTYGAGASHVSSKVGKSGLVWPSSTLANADRINLGASRSFYPSKKFAVWLWFKLLSTGLTDTYQVLVGRSPVDTNVLVGAQWQIDTGNSSGNNVRGQVGDGTTSYGPFPSTPFTRDAMHCVLFAYDPSTSLKIFKDGVLSNTVTTGVPASVLDLASTAIRLSNNTGGDIYRFGMADLSSGLRTPEALAAAEYAVKPFAFR